jgi:hypothetical protein
MAFEPNLLARNHKLFFDLFYIPLARGVFPNKNETNFVWSLVRGGNINSPRTGGDKGGGEAHLLIDTPDGFVVIDHKSFPGTIELEGERLLAFAGHAGLYARALERVTGRACREYWLHQPIAALMTKVMLDLSGR